MPVNPAASKYNQLLAEISDAARSAFADQMRISVAPDDDFASEALVGGTFSLLSGYDPKLGDIDVTRQRMIYRKADDSPEIEDKLIVEWGDDEDRSVTLDVKKGYVDSETGAVTDREMRFLLARFVLKAVQCVDPANDAQTAETQREMPVAWIEDLDTFDEILSHTVPERIERAMEDGMLQAMARKRAKGELFSHSTYANFVKMLCKKYDLEKRDLATAIGRAVEELKA